MHKAVTKKVPYGKSRALIQGHASRGMRDFKYLATDPITRNTWFLITLEIHYIRKFSNMLVTVYSLLSFSFQPENMRLSCQVCTFNSRKGV